MPLQNERSPSQTAAYSDFCEGPLDKVRLAYDETEGYVKSHPGSSALVTFGVGFGLGLLITVLSMPTRRPPRHWYDDYVPGWMSR